MKKLLAVLVLSLFLLSITACKKNKNNQSVPESVNSVNSVNSVSESINSVTENTDESKVTDSSKITNGRKEENVSVISALSELSGEWHEKYAGRGRLKIEQKNDTIKISVRWSSSAWQYSTWNMTGTYDEATSTISYTDCEKHNIEYSDEYVISSDIIEYSDGHGTIQYKDGSLFWTESNASSEATEFVR